MRRRDFVRAMLAASVSAKTVLAQQTTPLTTPVTPSAPPPTAAAAPGPTPWMRGLTAAKPLTMTPLVPDAVAETSVHFFTDTQLATLRHLSAILMPPSKGYPGAAEAETTEFLDFLIGVSPPDRQQMYQSGLDRLEAEAKQQFGIPFAAVNNTQADQLLRPWMRTWMADHPPAEPYARFINLAHSDIRTATLNSQAWSDAAKVNGEEVETGLYWFPIDPDIHRQVPTQMRTPTSNKRHV